MVDAILGGDGVAAETAARKHIARSITLVRRRSNDREWRQSLGIGRLIAMP